MTDDQINKAIAALLGITCKTGIPDFSGDLNEMHEAEKVLGKKLSEYGNQLWEMTIVSKDDFPECYIWHSTARQRAEAFLRTLGKWEEVQG